AMPATERERLASLDGAGFGQACGREGHTDQAFCAGVVFAIAAGEARSPSPRFCAPADHEALLAGALTAMPATRSDTMQEAAAQALIRAFPCPVRVNGR